MLTPVLKAAGYAVTTVAGGEDAIRLITGGQQFDVIVTDIDMPGMSGFDLAQTIHSDSRTAAVPIIGLSSMTSAEAVERGRQVGFYDYIAKFDRPGLIAALKEQSAVVAEAA